MCLCQCLEHKTAKSKGDSKFELGPLTLGPQGTLSSRRFSWDVERRAACIKASNRPSEGNLPPIAPQFREDTALSIHAQLKTWSFDVVGRVEPTNPIGRQTATPLHPWQPQSLQVAL